jgi:hypothetical protein
MKYLLTVLLVLSCSTPLTRREKIINKNLKTISEYKKLRTNQRNKKVPKKVPAITREKKAGDYTSEERFYFDNQWGISIADGQDTEYHKFPSASHKLKFGKNDECVIGEEVSSKFGVYTKQIICPTFIKKLECIDNYRDPDEEKVSCFKDWEYQGVKYHLSVKLQKYFHRIYWRQKGKEFEKNHKGHY